MFPHPLNIGKTFNLKRNSFKQMRHAFYGSFIAGSRSSDGIYGELIVLIGSLLCIQSNNDTIWGRRCRLLISFMVGHVYCRGKVRNLY